ncbi:MAG: hypothetical protein FJ149_06260 [Euryarchaeota archaeon]|nr:hypothetical protein [Euryarchaeota archaeon]
MPSSELFKSRDGTEFRLLPVPFCEYCSMPLSESFGVWGRCWRCNKRFREITRGNPFEVPDSPYKFRKAAAAGLYITDYPEKGSIGRLIKAIKTGGGGCDVLSEAIAHVLRTRYADISWDIIVHVPASPGKKISPAGRLALALAKETRTAVASVLELDPSYESDQGLPEAQKFDNMRDKVRVASSAEIVGRKILLVDDVMTTRGSAHWCSEELLKAGAIGVNVAVAGRSVDMRDLEFIGYAGPL